MQYGLIVANFDEYADTDLLVEWGIEADEAGWDGIFLADHLQHEIASSFMDPWIVLSGLAAKTDSIKLGTWVTPVPRRLPWQIARNLATLDHLSDGRVILGAGLGSPPEDYTNFVLVYDPKHLAKRFDESLDIMDGRWSDGQFRYHGDVFTITNVDLCPKPVQRTRIPIVTAGRWPLKRPIQRGARWDGIMPIGRDFPRQLPDDEIRECIEYYHSLCEDDPGDVFLRFSPDSPRLDELLELCENLGVTWALFGAIPPTGSKAMNLGRIREGPPLG
jgi:alkanesulfonate monooxygenase SsuD/methylene tetrahydromethanopterin reductase-like flavin-dependent oxidoreductase (luciferase family)